MRKEEVSENAFTLDEERLKRLFHDMPIFFLALNAIGEIVGWNRLAELTTGFGASEALGRPLKRFFPSPEEYGEAITAFEKPRNTFENWEMAFPCRLGPNRMILWHNLSQAHPISNWKTWVVGIDITERKRQEQEQATLLFRLEALADEAKKLRNGLGAEVPSRKTLMDFKLTLREQEIVFFAFRGDPNKIIAANLGISEGAIKAHLSSVFKKLNVHNRVEFVRFLESLHLNRD